MDTDEITSLLRCAEGETLDFKMKLHDTSTDRGKANLVCDVISMANTPREADAHIIFGVKELGNGTVHTVGLDNVPDDASWQQLLASATNPTPRFRLEAVTVDGQLLAVLTIPPDRQGPFMVEPRWRGKLDGVGPTTLRNDVVYRRLGSSNREADSAALRRIGQWMAGGPIEPLHAGIGKLEMAWDRFLDCVHGFRDNRRYILLAPRIDADRLRTAIGLAAPRWQAVIDLDPLSERGGLMSAIEGEIALHRSLYRIIPDGPSMALGGHNSLQWIYAKGLADSAAEHVSFSYRQWSAQYSHKLRSHLTSLAAALRPAPVTCVVLGYDAEEISFLRSILDGLSGSLGEALDVVIAADDPPIYQQIADEFEASVIPISLDQLCAGLQQVGIESVGSGAAGRNLPSLSGAPVALDPADVPWIEEEFEIVYLDSGAEETGDDAQAFLMGSEISWFALSRRVDVDRSATVRLRSLVEREMGRGGRAVRVNVYHTPGAGGTTVARRVVWDLHEIYPCVILKSNPSAHHAANKWAEDNAERIMRVGHAAQRPVLVLAEGSRVPERLLSDLLDGLRSRQVSAVVLQVLRRVAAGNDDERVVQLPRYLLESEAERFFETYVSARPERARELERVRKSGNERERVPFHFGLAAYGRDFLGLTTYVAHRLDGLDSVKREILQHIALAHHYGQQGVAAQLFAEILGVSARKPVELSDHFPDLALDLLIEDKKGVWRAAHALFAEEILRQTIGAGLSSNSNWRSRLPDAAIGFAHLCRGNSEVVGDSELDLVARIFIYRDSTELLGTEQAGGARSFSQLIEDIPLVNSAVRLLEELTQLFPDESHFHAHLARYLAFRMGDLDGAKSSVERALQFSSQDSVVYHMKGMIYRQDVYNLIAGRVDLGNLVEPVTVASEAFADSRKLRRDNEHGYISEVQMLLRLADYARQGGRGNAVAKFTFTGHVSVDTAIERAEDLLSQVAQLRTGESPSRFAVDCRAKLDLLYGDHEKALQGYRDLLGRTDVDQPSVRRSLVWTYLRKQERQWHLIKHKDMRQIESLLRDNLRTNAGDERTMRLWVQAARYVPEPPHLDELVEQFDLWHTNNPSLDSSYYLYVLYVLKYLDTGSLLAKQEAERYQEECQRRGQYRTDRTKSIEWLGTGEGIRGLVHQSRLGEWDQGRDFFSNVGLLGRVDGRVDKYVGPQKGWIDVEGLKVFYVPGRVGHQRRSLRQRVTCLVGFSYDGLRAWEVRNV